jgi:hypothetical protein
MSQSFFRAGVAVAVSASVACAGTTYMPRADGRISATSDGRRISFTKNGRRLASGMAGLEQAVAGNPAAEEHARQAARDFRTGMTSTSAAWWVGSPASCW